MKTPIFCLSCRNSPRYSSKKTKTDDLTTIRKPFLDQSFSFKKTIVFGHTPTDRLGVSHGNLWVNKNKIGIETGAGHGNYLSLADLSNRLQYQVPVDGKKKVHPKKASF